MTTFTIRIEDELKNLASLEAKKLGISLTLVVKNALKTFVESPKVVIGEVETVVVTSDLQTKMDKVGSLISQI